MVTNADSFRDQYYSIDDIVRVCRCSTRTAREMVSGVPDFQKKVEPQPVGRPKVFYHYMAIPQLFADFDRQRHSDADTPKPGLSSRQLAVAALRTEAVLQYEGRRKDMPAEMAAVQTVTDWQIRPRRREIKGEERIGRHTRDRSSVVKVGGFSVSTLKRWSSIYKERCGDMTALAPDDRKACGPDKIEVEESLIDFLLAHSNSTARADFRKAVLVAKEFWPGEWPSCSYKTLLRRVRERDPLHATESLSKGGIARFRKDVSPDVERDRTKMRYNEEWELDDFTKDWYAFASSLDRIMRPKCYGIIRPSTRQWIYGVTCEANITQQQVRAMIGIALASKSCGVPERIRFERGTVACDDYLEETLTIMGVKVSRTSMDGGRIHAGAIQDKASGHFQGKAVVESNIRRLHNIDAFEPSNVGPDERHTAPARVEMMKELAVQARKEGKPIMLPDPGEWQRKVFQCFEKANNMPHSGLPETIDINTGEKRHMSPNEYAMYLGEEQVQVMDQRYLPLFFEKCITVDVTKNGIKVNKESYGRFDDELKKFETVKVYALKDIPDICYVEELGRCCERYIKSDFSTSEQYASKKSAEKKYRNEFERLQDSYNTSSAAIIEMSRVMTDPVPQRPSITVRVPEFDNRIASMDRGIAQHKEQKEQLDRRFDFAGDQPQIRAARRGLVDKQEDLDRQLSVYGLPVREEVNDELNVL